MSKLAVVLAAVLLVCGVSGYAIAQSGGAKPKTVKACAKKKGGALRLAKKCRKGERRVTWAMRGPTGLTGPAGPQGAPGVAGQDGAPGRPGANGVNGVNGTNGTSTGETFFASAPFGANFGGGGACEAVPAGGPSITVTVPGGSYAQVMASVTVQRAGAASNTACVRVDGADVQFSFSNSLAAETRYIQRGTPAGTTDPLAAQPLTFPLSAGSHTISLRYGSAGGTSSFSNRNLYVTVFHPTQ
jgi:Collagen triple helix repeat (20 copies)